MCVKCPATRAFSHVYVLYQHVSKGALLVVSRSQTNKFVSFLTWCTTTTLLEGCNTYVNSDTYTSRSAASTSHKGWTSTQPDAWRVALFAAWISIARRTARLSPQHKIKSPLLFRNRRHANDNSTPLCTLTTFSGIVAVIPVCRLYWNDSLHARCMYVPMLSSNLEISWYNSPAYWISERIPCIPF